MAKADKQPDHLLLKWLGRPDIKQWAECGDFKKGAWSVVGGKFNRATKDNVPLCRCNICHEHGAPPQRNGPWGVGIARVLQVTDLSDHAKTDGKPDHCCTESSATLQICMAVSLSHTCYSPCNLA